MAIPGIAPLEGGANKLGSTFIDTGVVTWGEYHYLVVNSACVFTVLETNVGRDCLVGHGEAGAFKKGETQSDGLNLAGATIAVNMIISAPNNETFRNITLSSGEVLGYG